MKRQAPGLRRTANVLLSAALALGLSPVAAFAQVADASGAAADAAPTLTPPVSSEPVAPQSAPAPANDAQAAAQAAPAAAPAAPADAAALTPGWTQAGTCEWMIDAAGKLTVRPLGNGASGSLGVDPAGSTQSAPWCDQSKTGPVSFSRTRMLEESESLRMQPDDEKG